MGKLHLKKAKRLVCTVLFVHSDDMRDRRYGTSDNGVLEYQSTSLSPDSIVNVSGWR